MQHIVGEYSILIKMDVSDLAASSEWYESKLDLIPQNEYLAPGWRQFKFSDINNISVGLHHNPDKVGTGGEAFTIIVSDIIQARQQLINKGLDMTQPVNVGKGVQLVYFTDPDGNQLVLRQQDDLS